MRSRKIGAFGIVACVCLSLANSLQVFWLIWLAIEQVQMGSIHGTNMDILALVPFLMNILAIPSVLLGTVYLAIGANGRARRGIYFANLALFAALLVQVGFIQLFIWY